MLKKIPHASCLPILARFEQSEEAAAAIDAALAPADAIASLQQQELWIDLVNFYCHALPMRETLWLACLALELRRADWSDAENAAIALCKRWVQEPDEAKRRQAENQVTRLGTRCAPGWLAQAVFWNGSGSLGEPGQPVVLPPEFLYAKAAAGAINTASVLPQWRGHADYCARVSAMALDLARGGSGLPANG